MRRIVCRFEDESDFLRQFRWERAAGGRDEAAGFSFIAEFELPVGAVVQLTALVSALREQCHLKMTLTAVEPVGSEQGRVFRYRARVAPEDAVWLLAFHQKMANRRWLQELAA